MLVGHSFGAVAAVAYAARHPRQVERVVLLSLPYFGSEARALDHFRNAATPDRRVMTNMALAAVTCIVAAGRPPPPPRRTMGSTRRKGATGSGGSVTIRIPERMRRSTTFSGRTCGRCTRR